MSILTNSETRTGELISHEQLHDGSLAELLTEDDYNIHDKVPSLYWLNTHLHLSPCSKINYIFLSNLLRFYWRRRFVVLLNHCVHWLSPFSRGFPIMQYVNFMVFPKVHLDKFEQGPRKSPFLHPLRTCIIFNGFQRLFTDGSGA